MPSNQFKDLPFVDEDGYFAGVCSVQMGDGISLPVNVAEAAVPEDTEHFFYKLNAPRDGFEAEPKPTTAAECVACGVISHESQTAHCSELRELFQKLTEGSSEYHVVRGDNLSWRVEKIPKKTFEDVKAEKTAQLDSIFTTWYTDGATLVSSLGFEVDSDSRAMQDVTGLIVAAEASTTFAETGLLFMDANNEAHKVTLSDLKTLQLEIIAAGNAAYQEKWKLRDAIESAKTKDELDVVEIAFHPVDFSESASA